MLHSRCRRCFFFSADTRLGPESLSFGLNYALWCPLIWQSWMPHLCTKCFWMKKNHYFLFQYEAFEFLSTQISVHVILVENKVFWVQIKNWKKVSHVHLNIWNGFVFPQKPVLSSLKNNSLCLRYECNQELIICGQLTENWGCYEMWVCTLLFLLSISGIITL